MSSTGSGSNRNPKIGWRESNRISPANLAEYIKLLEVACQKEPRSADLHTCLGIAQANNFEIIRSLNSFQVAIELDPRHFFARLKYAELLLQTGSLPAAEEETRIAVELASSVWQSSMARRQLHSIRTMRREGMQ